MKKILVALFLWLITVEVSLACRCSDPGSVEEAFHYSSVVVLGKVISKSLISLAQTMDPQRLAQLKDSLTEDQIQRLNAPIVVKVELEVNQLFKGKLHSKVLTIFTPSQGSACGYTHFQEGKSFLIYGYQGGSLFQFAIPQKYISDTLGRKDSYWTSICTLTTDHYQKQVSQLEKMK